MKLIRITKEILPNKRNIVKKQKDFAIRYSVLMTGWCKLCSIDKLLKNENELKITTETAIHPQHK